MVDRDGSFTLSGIKQINIEAQEIAVFLYPNPVNDILTIKFNKSVPDLHLNISDVQGRVIKTIQTKAAAMATLDMNTFFQGVYFVEGFDGQKELFKKKVIKR